MEDGEHINMAQALDNLTIIGFKSIRTLEEFKLTDVLAEKTGIDVAQIRILIEGFDNPEEINDDPAKAPSKRLGALTNGYRKVAMGKTISEIIGIQAIRSQCPHFDHWLTKLEDLRRR